MNADHESPFTWDRNLIGHQLFQKSIVHLIWEDIQKNKWKNEEKRMYRKKYGGQVQFDAMSTCCYVGVLFGPDKYIIWVCSWISTWTLCERYILFDGVAYFYDGKHFQ